MDQSNIDIAIEIFANKIRTNTNINGLKIKKDLQSKMYADDTTFMINSDISLQTLILDLNNLSKMSGLKPNEDKFNIMRLGPLKSTNFTLPYEMPIKWTDGPINLLGIHIHEKISITHFNNKLSRVSKI